MNSPISQEQFAGAFWGFVRNVAAVITAIGTIVAVALFLARPSFDNYLSAQISPLIDRLNSQSNRLGSIEKYTSEIRNKLSAVQPFIEFEGRGTVVGEGPFRAGETVPIEFFMRRNLPCATDVIVQFASAEAGRILTSLTYVIPATRAPASFHPISFLIDVRLPEDMPAGMFSYRPILRPDQRECPGQTEVHAPPSNYFEVTRD